MRASLALRIHSGTVARSGSAADTVAAESPEADPPAPELVNGTAKVPVSFNSSDRG
jgi:hypothetical protein